jgi:hypothetical protein
MLHSGSKGREKLHKFQIIPVPLLTVGLLHILKSIEKNAKYYLDDKGSLNG